MTWIGWLAACASGEKSSEDTGQLVAPDGFALARSAHEAAWIQFEADETQPLACAVDEDRHAFCWGYSFDTSTTFEVELSTDCEHVSIGHEITCLDGSGAASLWTRNWVSSFTYNGPFVAFVAATWGVMEGDPPLACGLTAAGDLQCWAGEEPLSIAPADMQFTHIDSLEGVFCATATDGRLWCGWADLEEAGGSSDTQLDLFEPFPGLEIGDLDVAFQVVCGSNAAGYTYCGELGDEIEFTHLGYVDPVDVYNNETSEVCGIAEGAIECDTLFTHGLDPLVSDVVAALPDKQWTSVSIGDDYGGVLSSDGTLFCWGPTGDWWRSPPP